MKIDQFIEKTQQQVSRGYIDEAIEGLKQYLKSNQTFYKEVIGLSGRFADLQNQIDSGILTSEEGISQKGQVRKQILNILDRINQAELEPDSIGWDNSGKKASQAGKRIVYSFVVLGVVCLISFMIVIFYWLVEVKNSQTKPSVESEYFPKTRNFYERGDTINEIKPIPKRHTKQNTPTGKSNKPSGVTTTNPILFESFRFDVTTTKGSQNIELVEGEELKIRVFVNKPSFIRLIYKFMDGTAVLLDDQFVSAKNLRSWYTLSSTFECAAPFGNEQLFAYAQSEPFKPLETSSQDGYKMIEANKLERQLAEIKTKGDQIIKRGLKKRKNQASQKANYPRATYHKSKLLNIKTRKKILPENTQ